MRQGVKKLVSRSAVRSIMPAAAGVCLVAAVCACAAVTRGADAAEKKTEVPAGMEELKFGKINMIVPKGMKTKKHGNVITLEDVNEYLARRLEEMDKVIQKIDARLKALEKTTREQDAIFKHNLEELRASLDKVKEALPKEEEEKD